MPFAHVRTHPGYATALPSIRRKLNTITGPLHDCRCHWVRNNPRVVRKSSPVPLLTKRPKRPHDDPFRLSNRPLIGHTSVNRFGLVIGTLPRGFSAKLLPPSRRVGGRNFIPLVLMWHGRPSISCGIMSSPTSGTPAGHGLYQNHAQRGESRYSHSTSLPVPSAVLSSRHCTSLIRHQVPVHPCTFWL